MKANTNQTVVLDVVGLSRDLLGQHTPCLNRLIAEGEIHPLTSVTPAVTCPVQSTFLTGLPPGEHGCVGNGWYFRDLSEIWFWRQSNSLVAGEKVWEAARKIDPDFTCAKLFWWYNMYSSADYSVTPRPMYPADGRKIPDVYTEPASLRQKLTQRLGAFPLFNFWGPQANIVSSRWIADCTRFVFAEYSPALTLAYLPHLDYNLQRLGPDDPRIAGDIAAVDRLCGELIEFLRSRNPEVRIIVLAEYGIYPVTGAVHLNRILRQNGMIRVREELGSEKLDAGASAAFAVCDHQIAHIYVKKEKDIAVVRRLLENTPGVAMVLGAEQQKHYGLAHPRSGELVALADFDRWFSYYYWLNDSRAPDYANTVDIHRKPGYDPVELFIDPDLRLPYLQIAWKLAKKKLGWRTLFDVISLKTELVKGSHGRVATSTDKAPVFITNQRGLVEEENVAAAQVKQYILWHLFGKNKKVPFV